MKFFNFLNFICFCVFLFFFPACGDFGESFFESDSNDSISVFGSVWTEDGKPAQGARVIAQDYGAPSTPAAITEMTVDENGNFSGVIWGVDYAEIRFLIKMEGYTVAVYPSEEYLPIVATMGIPLDLGHFGFLQKTKVATKEEL